MDAVTYIKEYKRMCEYFDSKENPARACEGCPLEWLPNGCHMIEIADNAEKCVAAVEQWAKDHPIKTRQSEFLKMFPNAFMDGQVLNLCPKGFEGRTDCTASYNCANCRREYWLQEVE